MTPSNREVATIAAIIVIFNLGFCEAEDGTRLFAGCVIGLCSGWLLGRSIWGSRK